MELTHRENSSVMHWLLSEWAMMGKQYLCLWNFHEVKTCHTFRILIADENEWKSCWCFNIRLVDSYRKLEITGMHACTAKAWCRVKDISFLQLQARYARRTLTRIQSMKLCTASYVAIFRNYQYLLPLFYLLDTAPYIREIMWNTRFCDISCNFFSSRLHVGWF